MVTKILAPVDGSELSESILRFVRRFLLRDDAELLLLHVLPDDPLRTPEEEALAQQYLNELQARLSATGACVHQQMLEGDPATQILSYASAIEPALIVMSTHGRGGLGRWIRGSVAERVLRNSTHPLLMASPGGLDDNRGLRAGFRRILVPLDGSDLSAEVIPLVRDFALRFGSEVVLFHAAPLQLAPEQHVPTGSMVNLDRHRDALREAGVAARAHTDIGPCAASILSAVDEEHADLVAMTTHGRSGISRWLFGSVAEKVLRHCSAPILVLRRAGAVAEPESAPEGSGQKPWRGNLGGEWDWLMLRGDLRRGSGPTTGNSAYRKQPSRPMPSGHWPAIMSA